MRAYSIVTPSHEVLKTDWYLRTLPAELSPRFLHVEAAPVDFGTRHWHRVVVHKFDLLEQAFDEHDDGELFLLSDVDIRFYRPVVADLHERMRGLDLLFQNNRPHDPHPFRYLCTGFVVIRAGRAARSFFRNARAILEEADDPLVGDQVACIRALERGPDRVRFALLPEQYWVPRRVGRRWTPGQPLHPPADLRMHHANYTVGVANKLAQLEAVERLLVPESAAQAS